MIKRPAGIEDLELQSQPSRYLRVLTSGYLERSVAAVLGAVNGRQASVSIALWPWLASLKAQRLLNSVRQFDQ